MLTHLYRAALLLAVLGVVVAVALAETPMAPITDWVWIAGFVGAGAVSRVGTKPSRDGATSPTWDEDEDPYKAD